MPMAVVTDPDLANVPDAFRAEYAEYRKGKRWRSLRYLVRQRAHNRCEGCLRAVGSECAHLTYARIFREPLSDLVWLCRRCHVSLGQHLGERHAKPTPTTRMLPIEIVDVPKAA